MTRLSGTQPLQTPHIDIVITRRSGLLIETRTNLTGLKQFPMVCGVSLTRIYEFSWNVFLLFDVFQLFVLFIILKYCEKISNFNRGDFYIDFICNLHHIHENISLKWQVSKWILHHQLSVKYWEIRPNFAPCRAMELFARVISYLHDNPTRGDFETWSKQSKITCKQSSNLRTQHGIIHILQNDINTYGASTQKLTRMFFC